MASMIVLFCLFFILLIVCFCTSYKKIILTPQFGFVGGFLLSIGYALFWVERWDLSLGWATFWVLFGGTTLFVVFSNAMQSVFRKIRPIRVECAKFYKKFDRKDICQIDEIENWKLFVLALIQLFTIAFTVYYLTRYVNSNLLVAMKAVNDEGKFGEGTFRFPVIINQLRNLTDAYGYIAIYILAHRTIFKIKSSNIILIVSICLSFLNALLTGGRNGAVALGVSIFVFAYFVWGIKNKWRKHIKFKTLIVISAILLTGLLLFQTLGTSIGRSQNHTLQEYIAMYLSAEIKNLDIFVRKGAFGKGNSLSTTQTYANIAIWISNKFDFVERTIRYDQPFVYVNGYSLGNVYTIFYVFLYDGGYVNVILQIFIMAFVTSIPYVMLLKSNDADKKINIWLIIFCYMYFGVVFSFFFNWFHGTVFSFGFVYRLFYWVVLKFFLERVRLTIRT